MWLALLAPIDSAPLRLGDHETIAQEAQWFSKVRIAQYRNRSVQFRYFLMRFLSDHGRSGNLFVGSASSTTHFAQVCAQRAWRAILVLNHPLSLSNRR